MPPNTQELKGVHGGLTVQGYLGSPRTAPDHFRSGLSFRRFELPRIIPDHSGPGPDHFRSGLRKIRGQSKVQGAGTGGN